MPLKYLRISILRSYRSRILQIINNNVTHGHQMGSVVWPIGETKLKCCQLELKFREAFLKKTVKKRTMSVRGGGGGGGGGGGSTPVH